jgi:hypothetical protein
VCCVRRHTLAYRHGLNEWRLTQNREAHPAAAEKTGLPKPAPVD